MPLLLNRFYTQLYYSPIHSFIIIVDLFNQHIRLNYHIHTKMQYGISLLTYTLNTNEMDGG